MTQAELAADVDVDRETILNWERGKHQPNLENLLVLQRFFELPSIELLLGGTESFPSQELVGQLE